MQWYGIHLQRIDIVPFYTLCIPMDFSIHIDTISMGLPILYLKGLQVEVSKL